jgi:endonuclease-3
VARTRPSPARKQTAPPDAPGGAPTERTRTRPDPPPRPFDVDEAIQRLREAVRHLPKAAMFQLAEEGYDSLFEQLVACIISIRTLEETTLPTSRRLFAVARTPAEMAHLDPDEIDRLIGQSTFHEPKARQIHAIAQEVVEKYGGELPCDRDVLLGFRGVGPKCAALALSIACGEDHIGVDIHVHRVTNRWGYVQAKTPEATMAALEAVLPREYWIEINRLLVPFGKYVCTGPAPRCSTCPLNDMCPKYGVTTHR